VLGESKIKDERRTVPIVFEDVVRHVILGADVHRAHNVYFQYSLILEVIRDDGCALAADHSIMNND